MVLDSYQIHGEPRIWIAYVTSSEHDAKNAVEIRRGSAAHTMIGLDSPVTYVRADQTYLIHRDELFPAQNAKWCPTEVFGEIMGLAREHVRQRKLLPRSTGECGPPPK